jgi:hypothetical protein
MSYFGLSTNRQQHEDAVKKLETFNAKPIEERAAASRAMHDDEYASMAGVVTITQAEASYIDLNVRAFTDMGDAFAQFVPLAIGEVPIYKLRQDYPIRVNIGHLGGGPPQVKFQTGQSTVQVTPFQYFSEEFLVPNLVNVSFDIAKFHEKEIALMRVAYQMKLARQKYILNLMTGAALSADPMASIAAYYAQATPFAGHTPYVLDPGVDSASIATTNTINATIEGGLTKNVFRAIRSQHILARSTPEKMFIPISGRPWESYWNQASIVALVNSQGNQNPASAIPPTKWEEAVDMGFTENGQYMEWFGMRIFLQPVNILTAGYFVVATDKPAVIGWDQMSASVSDEDELRGALRSQNRRYEARSIALAQPDPLLLNFSIGKMA